MIWGQQRKWASGGSLGILELFVCVDHTGDVLQVAGNMGLDLGRGLEAGGTDLDPLAGAERRAGELNRETGDSKTGNWSWCTQQVEQKGSN